MPTARTATCMYFNTARYGACRGKHEYRALEQPPMAKGIYCLISTGSNGHADSRKYTAKPTLFPETISSAFRSYLFGTLRLGTRKLPRLAQRKLI